MIYNQSFIPLAIIKDKVYLHKTVDIIPILDRTLFSDLVY